MSKLSKTRFPENPSIIFIGTPDFSIPALEGLIRGGYDVAAVVTQPDRPRGRGRRIVSSPVKDVAVKNDIRLFQPEKVNSDDFRGILRDLKPDLFIVIAFGQILKRELLDIPKFGALNIHASLLPKYRGAAPIQWAIINNESVTGITIIKMTEGLDDGPIYMQEELPILKDETTGHLYKRISLRSGEMIVRFLKEMASNRIKAQLQDDTKATYAPKIEKNFSVIDWTMDTERISSLIRALDPVPGARTILDDNYIKLFSSSVSKESVIHPSPGKITITDEDFFLVATGTGAVEIREIQLPGKKRVAVKDFLHGHTIPDGSMFE